MLMHSLHSFKRKLPIILSGIILFAPLLQAQDAPVQKQQYDQGNLDKYFDSNDNERYEPISTEPDQTYRVIIDPKYSTKLSAEVATPVKKIYKRFGESFSKGDVLIQLDDRVYQSNLKKAQAVLSRARTEYDGKKQLFHDNVASLFELKEAEANVAIAEADLAKAEKDLDSTTIKAPYDGKVVDLKIEEYELPKVGDDLIDVLYDKVLLAKVLIPSTLLPKIHPGDPFRIRVNETDKTITAKIQRIGAVIDPSSSTIQIEGEINNEDEKLKPGMTGSVIFDESANQNAPNR